MGLLIGEIHTCRDTPASIGRSQHLSAIQAQSDVFCEYTLSPFEQFKLPTHWVLENCWEYVMDKEDKTRVLKFLMMEIPRLWWKISISMERVVLWRLMSMHCLHDLYIRVLNLRWLNIQTEFVLMGSVDCRVLFWTVLWSCTACTVTSFLLL